MPREGLPWQPSGEGSVLRSVTKIPYTVWHGRKKKLCQEKEARHIASHKIQFHLYEVYRLGKSTETKRNIMVARGWGKQDGGAWARVFSLSSKKRSGRR